MRITRFAMLLLAAFALAPTGLAEARNHHEPAWSPGKSAHAPAHGRHHAAPPARGRHVAPPARQRHMAPPPPWRPGFARPGPQRPHVAPPKQIQRGPVLLPPRAVAQRLARQNYRNVQVLGERRGVYQVQARDRRGRPVLLVVDGRTGQVLRSQYQYAQRR